MLLSIQRIQRQSVIKPNMDYFAQYIGLGSFSARRAVDSSLYGRTIPEFHSAATKLSELVFDDDNTSDTDSTASMEDELSWSYAGSESSMFSLGYNHPTVRFAEPLVSAVHERPSTLPGERHELYYTDAEYKEFRQDYYLYSKRKSTVVQFHPDEVTAVHVVELPDNPSHLYYSDADLQVFLDDFVTSLQQQY